MRTLPELRPDSDRRFVTRVSADPHVRVDSNDYSLDPRFAGRRVEVRVSLREVRAMALDTAELVALHARSFARHRTLTRSTMRACCASCAQSAAPPLRSKSARSHATTR